VFICLEVMMIVVAVFICLEVCLEVMMIMVVIAARGPRSHAFLNLFLLETLVSLCVQNIK